MSKHVYADYAAATPIDDRVISKVAEVSKVIGNPSSLHGFGRESNDYLNSARSTIAKFLNCQPNEITFTSSGTESNNLALIGTARANSRKGSHIITSAIEHPSIINTCRALEREGFEVTYLRVDKNGYISDQELKSVLRKDTILVSIHLANSEIGVVQDIKKLSKITHEQSSANFHTDACQAATFVNLNAQDLEVDLLTFNGTKLYGPKGVAVLFVKEGVEIFPIVFGGGQEKSLRSGTENVPSIVGLAQATTIVESQRENDVERISKLRDELHQKLFLVEGILINVANSKRLPNHLSIVVNNTSENDLVRAMDEKGIAVSSGSACSSKSLDDSHVLNAIGLMGDQANKTLRITLGRYTTKAEITEILEAVKTL